MTSWMNVLRTCGLALALVGLPGGTALESEEAAGGQSAETRPVPRDSAPEPLVPLVLTQIEAIDEPPAAPDPFTSQDLLAPDEWPTPDDPGPVIEAVGPASGAQVTPPLAVTQLDDGRARLDTLDGDQRLSLRFSEPMPITELLLFLFRDTPFSIVPEPGVEGEFIGELKDVTLREALDLVLHPHDLDYAVENASITVFQRRLATRIFPIDHVVTRRTLRSVLRTQSGWSGDSGTGAPSASTAELTNEGAGDPFDDLSAGVRTLLSPEGRFNVDRKAALLQVTDLPDRISRVASYLEAVSARLNRQVLLQAEVVEVALDESYADGIDWAAIRAAIGAGTLRPDTRGVRVGVPTDGPAALLAALRGQGRVNVLAKPRVVTMNNEPAIMQIGTQTVLFASSGTDTDESSPALAEPLVGMEGLTLVVTPQISPDGIISMSISPRVTERARALDRGDRPGATVLRVREADTVVRVFEGETVVVAGLMQDYLITQRGKVPVMGSIPLLGRMFRTSRTIPSKTDLVILLTPRIVAPGGLTAALTRH